LSSVEFNLLPTNFHSATIRMEYQLPDVFHCYWKDVSRKMIAGFSAGENSLQNSKERIVWRIYDRSTSQQERAMWPMYREGFSCWRKSKVTSRNAAGKRFSRTFQCKKKNGQNNFSFFVFHNSYLPNNPLPNAVRVISFKYLMVLTIKIATNDTLKGTSHPIW